MGAATGELAGVVAVALIERTPAKFRQVAARACRLAGRRDARVPEQQPAEFPEGLQPVQEKNFAFEMTLSLLLEEGTHRPVVTKCPEPLLPLFAGEQPLVTKEMGRKLRAWAEGGEEYPAAGAATVTPLPSRPLAPRPSPRVPRGISGRTPSTIAFTCSGVVPQQPPTIRAPACTRWRA